MVRGLWVEVVLYKIPLLVLTNEAYFRVVDTGWTHDGQEQKAYAKGMRLLEAGCVVSEYRTRRRRDFYTHRLLVRGLLRARAVAAELGYLGKILGTSSVHLARLFSFTPNSIVGYKWFIEVAAITGDYRATTSKAFTC